MRLITSVLGVLFLLLCTSTSSVSALDDTVPSGAYYFSGSGVMSNSSGTVSSSLFSQILKGKQMSVIDEMVALAEGSFSDKSVTGDLDKDSGGSLWSVDTYSFTTNTKGTSFKMRQGSTVYTIYVPRGIKVVTDTEGNSYATEVNQSIIANTIKAINEYKEVVKEGILAGSLTESASFNIYSMYPSKQVPLMDVLEDATDENGRKLGYKSVKATSVDMQYSLDYFLNPLFGKMDASVITALGDDWSQKVNDVKITAGSNEKISVVIDDDYMSFVSDESDEREMLTTVESSAVTQADGVKSWKAEVSGKKVEPSSYVDVGLRVVTPQIFTSNVNVSTDKFVVDEATGYSVVPDIKLLISHSVVYLKEGDSYKNSGGYEIFGIDGKGLVLSSIKLDADENPSKNGKTVGVLVPLWYKEMVIDTASSGEDSLYYTGRVVKFSNDYSGKMTLDGENKDLLGVDVKTGGLSAIAMRKFAFLTNSEYTASEDHISLAVSPTGFMIHTDFITDDDDGEVQGFVIYRNNSHLNDSELISWLGTSEAQAMTDGSAEELLAKLNGSFDMESTELSYWEWTRMEEIRNELDVSFQSKMWKLIRVTTMVFGVFVIFYSILLVIAYWLDVLNPLTDFSILNSMTFKRFYPITTEDDIGYLSSSGGEVRYVTMWNIIFVCLVGISVGILFIFCTPLLESLLWFYYKINSAVGGM